ncbi:HAMP domain-containing protein [Desulfohalobiaceae bacterium Ax17]|uniref:sensor histidine kinase NtrY-like n=1 Tax=Desulfovulcanus ferrireducens TaxID=2831190 RepID=UPI00207BBA8B|nr:ATP-binding protein [Desulfovulcanus ferrireducens]MBT8763941.1 HAMP domain-containing protein [Desulfovulcanus ferrireducens]
MPYNSSISINPSSGREKKRRQREIILALLGIGLIVLLSWVELKFFGVNSYLFLAFFNLNLILLLLVLFLVVRNVFKLLIERRRKVLGAKLRTRLVLVFISLSIIPTLLMFFIAVRFVQTSVDYWFKSQVENSMQQALEVGQAFYNSAKKRLEKTTLTMLTEIRKREFLWGGKGMDKFIRQKRDEYGLSLTGVINSKLDEQNWHAQPEWVKNWSEIKKKIPFKELMDKPRYWTAIWPGTQGDLIVGILPVDNAKTGFLVVGETLDQGLLLKLDGIVRGIEEYKHLKSLKYPLKAALYTILGIMTLLIILGSIWFGFKLAREISAPVQALAAGTQRIARGDLSVRLEDHSDDELGLLVRSFNNMARDLEKSQESLTRANLRLAQQNIELEARGRYMQAVLDNITAGVISLDRQGRVSTINKAAEFILGIDSKKIIGRSPLELVRGEYGQMIRDVFEQLSNLPGSQWQRQVDVEIGGRVVKLLVNAVLLRTEGKKSGIVAVFEDITELEKMQRLAAWKEVARRIAHEIKNPLTPIKLSAQRLEKRFSSQIEDQVFTQCTRLIIRQVEHLQALVQEFSGFAKLPEIHPRLDYLAPLLEELIKDFEHSYRHIKWELTFLSEIPKFKFDREAIKRVFMNLLLNAAEVLVNEEAPHIQVRAIYDKPLQRVNIEVADNGPGFTPEERSRMFEPYYSRKKGGTGLGLTIVKSIVTDHHGYVRVKPNKPKGSVFVVELPV